MPKGQNPTGPILKITKIFLFLSLFGFIIFKTNTTYAQCRDDDCCPCDGTNPLEYCCQSGQMCCTGGGCPSWVCADEAKEPTNHPDSCGGAYPDGVWTCCDRSKPWQYWTTRWTCPPCAWGSWYICNCKPGCQGYGCASGIDETLCNALPGGVWVPCCTWESCRDCNAPCPYRALCPYECERWGYWEGVSPPNTCEWCPTDACSPPPPPPPECITTPGAPSLNNPADGYTTLDTNILDFGWSANGWGEDVCTGNFRLQVDNNSDFSSPEHDSGLLPEATTTQIVTLSEPEGQMFWRVRAQNEIGGTWSASRSFTLNFDAPIAQMDSPAGKTTIGTNVAQTFVASAIDTGGLMTRMQLARVRDLGFGSYGSEIFLDQPGGVVDQVCAGGSCTITRDWTPTSADIGTWIVYMNAYDTFELYDGKCTGSPVIPLGFPPWSDCGRTGLTDAVAINVANDPPTGTQVTGPGNVRLGVDTPIFQTKDYTALFNLTYSDPNKQEVQTTWSSTCPMTQEFIDSIYLRVRGTDNAGWPVMEVVVGNIAGTRSTACNTTVNWGAYQTVNCPIGQAVSTIDVVYTNDFGSRDLFVDYIDIHYDASGTNNRIVQAESNDPNGDNVIYDRADVTSDPLANPYDGIDVLTGRQAMLWAGSLRFPVPISFQPPFPIVCRLDATVTDIGGAVGNTTSLNVAICGSSPGKASNPIPADGEQDVMMPVTVSWSAPADWGDTCGGAGHNYTVHTAVRVAGSCPDPDPIGSDIDYTSLCVGTPEGSESCTDPFFDVRDTEFCWYIESNNGEYSGLSAANGAEVWWFEVEDPLHYQNWMTTLGGSLYAGGFINEFPDPADYVAFWNPPYVAHESVSMMGLFDNPDAALISSNDITISSSDPTPGYFPESESDLWVEFANFTQTWPTTYEGLPPAGAIELPRAGEDCIDLFRHNPPTSRALRPRDIYKADVACVATAIADVAPPDAYRLQNPGVAVVYVTGNGDLEITEPFLTNNDNYRILFVTGTDVNVIIDEDLSLVADPNFNSASLIEAAFVVQNSIEFEGIATQPAIDPEADPDDSIVVEGPIITKSIQFNRNRGPLNGYPAEIIRYNIDYIYNLTDQERNSDEGNYTGLFVVDVDWISEE